MHSARAIAAPLRRGRSLGLATLMLLFALVDISDFGLDEDLLGFAIARSEEVYINYLLAHYTLACFFL